MFGTVVRYFARHPARIVSAVARDPIDALIMLQDQYVNRLEHGRAQIRYQAEDGWENRLHGLLGLPWPCEANSRFSALLSDVTGQLAAAGIRVGPESFGVYNDGDVGFVRAIWCLVRHLRPRNIVETGVARGFTSRFILEALEWNGSGHLWSIDLPPLNPALRSQVGMAVGDRLRERWTYIEGSSRRHLPRLLSQLGEIDLFIHDSLHTERNVRFELDRAWKVLKPGGALVIDDIDINWAFDSFTKTFSGYQSIVCEAEPLHPDTRRFNQKGLFAIILKDRRG
jgi:hypothetical protein